MKKSLVPFAAVVLSSILPLSAGVVAGFGTSASNIFTINSNLTINLNLTQNSDGIVMDGNDAARNKFGGSWATPWPLLSNDGLTINITNPNAITPTPTSPFKVILKSSDNQSFKLFSASFAEFVDANGDYSLSFEQLQGDEFTDVGSFVFDTGNEDGGGHNVDFDLSVNSLSSTVPEPSTYALLAIAGIASAWIARRRIAKFLRTTVSAVSR